MNQNFEREERGFFWPAFWKIDDCLHNVKFTRSYQLNEQTEFVVSAKGVGYVTVNRKKYRFGEKIVCPPGGCVVQIFVGNKTGLPCAFVEGEHIYSDDQWMAEDFVNPPKAVGWNAWYLGKENDPNEIRYDSKIYEPAVTSVQDGLLCDFGKTLTAELLLQSLQYRGELEICYGESQEEALDRENCYLKEKIFLKDEYRAVKRAFRYVFLPERKETDLSIGADHRFIHYPCVGKFHCDDEMLNKIWEISEETFALCTGVFFIDGVKRDRWIWSGDAYQSYFVNQYLYFDEEVNKRTILALRGRESVEQHINTIVDYSLYWIISIWNHYEMTGDLEFVRLLYDKMVSLIKFCEERVESNGFLIGKGEDWVFVDWAEIDKEGPVCAVQILYAKCFQVMSDFAKLLEKPDEYGGRYTELCEKINEFFWDEQQGAYIDSFTSGKKNVTRHANIFAILFDFANTEKQELILKNVLNNPAVPAITTPYFQFFALEAGCKSGDRKQVYEKIADYWGGMVKKGTVTFWEEYRPEQTGKEQYAMYGDPYGKSLCHAWGASPIYLIGRYFMGVEALEPGYKKFLVKPETELWQNYQGEVPVKGGSVKITKTRERISVWTDCRNGILEIKGKKYPLAPEEICTVEL